MLHTVRNADLPSTRSLGFGALVAFRVTRLTLDLLLATREACLCEALSRFTSLCDAPRRIDWFSVDDNATIRSIVEDVAQAFARYLLLAYTMLGSDWRARGTFCASPYWLAQVHGIVVKLRVSRKGSSWFRGCTHCGSGGGWTEDVGVGIGVDCRRRSAMA